MSSSPLILVAGMHRSGTSAVTRMLNLLGVSLGSGPLLAAAADNRRGFWEARDFVLFNDRLLAELGGSWSSPPTLRPGWANHPDLVPWRNEADELLTALRGDGAARHAVKDPRLALLIPFWSAVSPDLHVVMPVREPVAVAQSLHHRNGMAIDEGVALWLRYVSAIVTSEAAPLVVPYEHLLASPASTAHRICSALGLPATSDQVAAASASISPELNDGRPEEDGGSSLQRLAQEVYDAVVKGEWTPSLADALVSV